MSLNIFEKFVQKHLDWDWKIWELSSNTGITSNFVQKYPEGINGKKWDISLLSGNPSITLDFIEKHLDWKWNMDHLSSRENITLEFIEKYPNGIGGKPWNMGYLSANAVITLEFIEKYPQGINGKKWDMLSLSRNPNITSEFLEKYPDWGWSISELITNFKNIRFTEKSFADIKNNGWIMVYLSQYNFEKDILEDNNNRKNILYLFMKKDNNSIFRFLENEIYDRNVNRIILSYLCF